ncbi:MAG: 3-methylornithyl-N6-L-lysine dehydrogenase PylD, partial [Desulfitobacterium hafniense]|nr:3-methylornithyl-N6-L-lysine dehydrogenase PylD [Desulfitobacterium hafniense]
LEYAGTRVFITGENDVSGFAEAISQGANIIFMADDNRFIAFDSARAKIIDNAEATGRGYVSALYHMAGGLKNKEVLVIGAGRVGISAIQFLQELNTHVRVYEKDENKLKFLDTAVKIENTLNEALPKYKYIVDATPAEGFLDIAHLHPEAMLACPGIPLGLSLKAKNRYKAQIIHDPLQIGVVTMLAMSLNTDF